MSNFNIGDVVVWLNELYKVTYVYSDGTLKLQSIRGKTASVYYHIYPDYVQKKDEKDEQI